MRIAGADGNVLLQDTVVAVNHVAPEDKVTQVSAGTSNVTEIANPAAPAVASLYYYAKGDTLFSVTTADPRARLGIAPADAVAGRAQHDRSLGRDPIMVMRHAFGADQPVVCPRVCFQGGDWIGGRLVFQSQLATRKVHEGRCLTSSTGATPKPWRARSLKASVARRARCTPTRPMEPPWRAWSSWSPGRGHRVQPASYGTRKQLAGDVKAPRPADVSHPLLRAWLEALPIGRGWAAAFETRIWWSPRGATGTISELRQAGYQRLAKSERFIVSGGYGPLRDGELDRARQWGVALARALATRGTAPA